MADQIYLMRNSQLVEMTVQPYDAEKILQQLVAEHPKLLAGSEMTETPRRWLHVTSEINVPRDEDTLGRWALDHLFLDQDGIPTLIEVKRSSDTRIRREVVGQMLDYASGACSFWSADVLWEKLIQAYRGRKVRSLAYENDPSTEALLDLIDDDEIDENEQINEFWSKVETNLRAGRIRLIFVADEIPQDLQRIVEFLGNQMSLAEVYAIEVKQYVGGGEKAFVPRLIGRINTTASEHRAARRQPSEFLLNVVEAYNSTSVDQVIGRAVNYRQIKPKDWPDLIHYEFVDFGKKIGAEIHVERVQNNKRDDLNQFLQGLSSKVQSLFPSQLVEWKSNWQRGGSRLGVIFDKQSSKPEEVATGMKKLIIETESMISRAIQNKV